MFQKATSQHRFLSVVCSAQHIQKRTWKLWGRCWELVHRSVLFLQVIYCKKRRFPENSTEIRSGWSCVSEACRVKVVVTIASSRKSGRSVPCPARILQEVTRSRQEDQRKWKIQEDYEFSNISWDNGSAVLPWILETSVDQFLQLFQTEGPLIHILHQSMLQLLKQVMFRFLKQSVVQGKTVSELLKVDSKMCSISWKMRIWKLVLEPERLSMSWITVESKGNAILRLDCSSPVWSHICKSL